MPSTTEDAGAIDIEFEFDELMLWDLETPNLYSIRATLLRNGSQIDTVEDTFGMRKIEARGRYLYLNGKPIYLVGATDQPDTPDRNVYKKVYSPPTDEEIQREIRTAKALGLNLLRKHVKCEHPRYLYWADRLGILIWEEPPFFWTFSEQAAQLWKDALEGMILRDRNHPSIVVWGLLNENWGVREQEWDARQPQFAREAYDLTKRLDPTRLVMGNSGGTQVRTDLHDRHTYISAPERHEEFRDFMQKVRYAGKPVLATEFGLPGPPELDTLRAQHGGEMPWWITEPRKAGDRDLQSRYLLPFEERFRKWGFDERYEDYAAFKLAHGKHNFQGMKYEIEQIRQNPDIAGYLITSFCDAFSEPFGLLDYYGNLKPHYQDLHKLQRQDLLIIETARRNFWSGDEGILAIYLSNFSGLQLRGSRLHWRLSTGREGDAPVAAGEAGGVSFVGELQIPLPVVAEGARVSVTVSLMQEGAVLVQNALDLWAYPRALLDFGDLPRISIYQPASTAQWSAMGVLKDGLRHIGYDFAEGFDPETPLVLASVLDDRIKGYVGNGGKALLLMEQFASDQETGVTTGNIQHYVIFHSLQPGLGMFSDVPHENPLGWQFSSVFPTKVVVNQDRIDRPDMLASAYGCFMRADVVLGDDEIIEDEVAPTIVQFRYGKGKLIICTFRLVSTAPGDPVAVVLLRDLIRHAASDFLVTTELPLSAR